MRKLLFLFFLIFVAKGLSAAVFTVTSNANSGGGTLREALTLANANGSAIVDYIYFNLPGSTIADVTIPLETELPILTSNIIIDGTTQPFAALPNPSIRISLIRITADYFNGLRLDNASNIEIYGISFSNFKADPLGPIDEKKGGIYLRNSSDVVIGAPNKSNCFGGNYAGILSPFLIPRFDVQNIKISSNIFGLGENGLNNVPNETGIDISFMKNSVIGGDSPEEGNLIATNTRNGIALGGADGNIKIANNIIGLDKNLFLKASATANGIYVNGSTCIPNIYNNTIAGQAQGILIDYVNGGFTIGHNRIGTGLLGTENYANGIGIHVNFSLAGMIGGTSGSDQNTIAFNKTAILIEISYPISILKNSVYCNDAAVIFKNLPPGKVITQSRITTITALGASGTYLPNSKIELFYVDDCADCQGKTWLATLSTDANGMWAYNGLITGKITSMGTNPDGATSTFSKPLIDDSKIQIFGTYCGQSIASIKGLNVYDASVYRWYDSAGQLVGSSKDLENVIAGTYYLKAGQLGACDVTSASYTIDATGNGIDDSKKIVINTLCGAANGSISQIGIANNLSRTWYNITGAIVATSDDLQNVSAGKYYFKAGLGTCEITSPTYTINNVNKSFLPKDFSITPASCGLQNGSITIKSYQTDAPTAFTWTNEDGSIIGNEGSLNNLFPGTYKLTASDGKDCINVVGTFKVDPTELPVIDFTKLQSFTSCDGKTVSVNGAEVKGATGPFISKWVDENGNLISDGLAFDGKKAGKYYLLIKDKYGCEVSSETIDFTKLENKVLQVPNSITPNGDGTNDTWKIIGAQNYPEAEFYIFNRNGDKVFYSKGYSKDFDGTTNGKMLSVGVYYYLIDLKTDCGRLSGSLTILK
jgi:gliding motility-associated-like protein